MPFNVFLEAFKVVGVKKKKEKQKRKEAEEKKERFECWNKSKLTPNSITFFLNQRTSIVTTKLFNGFPLTVEWNIIFLPDMQSPLQSNPCLPESRVNPTTAHLEFYAPETHTVTIPWIDQWLSQLWLCILCVPAIWNMCSALILPWTPAQPSSLSSPASPSVMSALSSLAGLKLLSLNFP